MAGEAMAQDRDASGAAGSANGAASYDVFGRYAAEIYDREETQLADVALILSLAGDSRGRVLEPFCGNGRILLPLAQAGFGVVGLDLSDSMLASLAQRVQQLPQPVRNRIEFAKCDVVVDPWPTGFDLVVLAANCLYELATTEEQQSCIRSAAGALPPGGHLYLDNNHMEGDLDPEWCKAGVRTGVYPTGACFDDTVVAGTIETIWHDSAKRLVKFRRTTTVLSPDGKVRRHEWVQQKHPPSTDEMRSWLMERGFAIEQLWGDRQRSQYRPTSERAVFWAVRR